MLHRLAVEQSESDTASTTSSSTTNEFEKLDINSSHPSMSSVFSSEKANTTSSGRSTPRSASPSRSDSPSRRKSSIPNPFRRSSHGSSSDESKQETALARWLRDGTVIYKSVGLGLMDLVVGAHLVKMAKKKEIGTQVGSF
jgi:hypothetical protein